MIGVGRARGSEIEDEDSERPSFVMPVRKYDGPIGGPREGAHSAAPGTSPQGERISGTSGVSERESNPGKTMSTETKSTSQASERSREAAVQGQGRHSDQGPEQRPYLDFVTIVLACLRRII